MLPVLRSVRSTTSLHASTVRKLALGRINASPPPVELLPVSPFLLSPVSQPPGGRSSPAADSNINVRDVSTSPFFVQVPPSDPNAADGQEPDEDIMVMKSRPISALGSTAPVTATGTMLSTAWTTKKSESEEEAKSQITVSGEEQ